MLYLDGISIAKIKNELEQNLKGKKINRIFQKNDYAISLHFGKIELLLSCVHNLSICYITNLKEQALVDISSSFIANLRKNLLNAMLINIEQLGFDRILVFHFSKINELGEIKYYKLYFEMFSRNANIIFTDRENIIIETFKREALNSKVSRVLFNGAKYEMPYISSKINCMDITEVEFNNFKNENTFIANVEGIGKYTDLFTKNYEDFKNILDIEKLTPTIYFNQNNIVFATILNFREELIKDYFNFDNKLVFNSYNDMINKYIDLSEVSTSFMLLKNRLSADITKKIKKLQKTLTLIEKDINEENNLLAIKQKADILATSLYSVKKGMDSINLFDFYNNVYIDIALNPLINPKENLDRIYREYNKTKRRVFNAKRRYEELNQEIDYLHSVETFINNSSVLEDLRNIEEELIKVGYMKPKYKLKKTKVKKEPKYGIIEQDNCIIYYGRNNMENDYLSFKFANKNDMWLHAKDIPGSHVILKAEYISDKNILVAAKIAAKYSKASLRDKVKVDYTLKKNLNKPAGSKPGFVTYVNEKSITVIKE